MRELAFRVTIKDCTVQTFRSGGKGGQNQNKRDTGVRVIHRASRAKGESREERTQLLNKRRAFRRMGESKEFQNWARLMVLKLPSAEKIVEEQMKDDQLLIEVFMDGKWHDESSI